MTGDPAGRSLPEAVAELQVLARGVRSDPDPVNRLLERIAARDGQDAEQLRAALTRIGAAAVLGRERP